IWSDPKPSRPRDSRSANRLAMKPEIEILGISIKTFGVAFALGFICCGAVVARRLRELGKPADWAYEVIFAALVGGVVGARGYYLIQHYDQVKHDLIGNAFSGSGLVWYGGVIGGAIAVIAWMRWRGALALWMLDACAIALALGYAIGRIGCQVSGAAWLAALLRRGGIGALLPADA